MPAKVSVRVNINGFYKELSRPNNARIIEKEARPIMRRVVREAQEDLIQDFENHPITQELDAGVNASNTSGTLGGYGNLFTFIGFPRRTRPTQPIRKIVTRHITFTNLRYRNRTVRFEMRAPTKEEIFDETPLPWASDSWARRVELGLAGFGSYLLKPSPSSRSGGGLQVGSHVRAGKFRNTSYMTGLINRFYRKIGGRLL